MFPKKLRLKQVVMVALAFIVVSVLLFGGEMLNRYLLERKSAGKVGAIPAIQKYEAVEKEKGIELALSLSQVENLQETVEPLIEEVQETMKKKVFKVKIESPTAESLEEACYELSFLLEEAQSSGAYRQLFTGVEDLEEKYQGEFRVYIGEEFFYLQLADRGGAYYSIVPRRVLSGVKGGEG